MNAKTTAETSLSTTASGTEQNRPPANIPDHTLLRCIGRGSYGEVWLARNVMGTYRAVKIVYRRNFDDERPFQREYHGIQTFEPVSRSHEGLMDILQVGRNDAEQSFYYVMELADDLISGQQIDPEHYQPKSLRREGNQRGCLSPAECVALGLALTDALSALHRRGLVHRDIKPSNIIFVNGIPKLADIGLVTSIDATLTYVGTEGFMPREGPGTPHADIYSLGKVLYEISTGKDRQEFPDLPTAMRTSAERNELLELNEVLVKACASDPHKRYQTAEEMHADLALLRSGKSVRRLRVVELRLARARSAGMAAAAVALLAIGAVWFFAREARVERDSRRRIQDALDRAEAAEQVAQRESYARAMLLAHEAVQANNFGLVRELLEQTRSFAMKGGATNSAPRPTTHAVPIPQQRQPRYRGPDQSAFVLGRCDSGVNAVTVSPDGQWLAAGEENGRVLLWNLSDCQLRDQWQVGPSSVEYLDFSSDNGLLAAGSRDGGVRVLAMPSGDVVGELREASRILDLLFAKDSWNLAFCSSHGLALHDFATSLDAPTRGNIGASRAAIAPDFTLVAALQAQGLVWYWLGPETNLFFDVMGNRFPAHAQAISPDGRWLATAFAHQGVELWSFAEKRIVRSLAGHTAAVAALAWSTDSRLLASGGFDQTVAVWDTERGVVLRRLRGHQDDINTLAFSPDGRILYSGSADQTIRVWTDFERTPATEPENSDLVRDTTELSEPIAPEAGTARGTGSALPWEWCHLKYECRDEAASVLVQCARSVDSVAVSPDGAWLAAGDGDGRVLLWSLPDRKLRQQWTVMRDGVECLAFAPDSRRLAAGCIDGWVRTLSVPSGKLVAEFREEGRILDLRFATDGRSLAYCSIQGIGFHDFAAGAHLPRRGNFSALRAAIAPDFKLLAALLPHGLVWYWGNPQTNVIFPGVIGNPFNDHAQAISPDGRWLATALVDRSIEIWSLAEKKPLRRLVGHTAAVEAVAWSADSRLLASGSYDQTVAVWEPERGTLLRRLRGHQDHITAVAFSSDGRSLFSGSQDRTVRAWTDLETASDPHVIALPAQSAEVCLGPGARFVWGVAAADNAFWALKTQPVLKPYGRLQGAHAHLAISPDGQWLVAAYKVCVVFRNESHEYTPYATHEISLTTEVPPIFSRDGSRVALVATDGLLAVWQLEPWRELARWKSVEGYPTAIVFDPPGKRILVAREKFGAFLAEIETGRLLAMPKERESEVNGIDISSDNRLVAMSHHDGTVVFWACAAGEQPRSLGPVITERADASSIAFSPDGRRLAVGLADGKIHIWDVNHRMLVGVLKGHRQVVWQLGFNPDDDTLVSVSPDELRVWRVASSD